MSSFPEHSLADRKLRAGGQDTCGVNSGILPFLLMMCLQNLPIAEFVLTSDEEVKDFTYFNL
jgi:hypothetical protein